MYFKARLRFVFLCFKHSVSVLPFLEMAVQMIQLCCQVCMFIVKKVQ